MAVIKAEQIPFESHNQAYAVLQAGGSISAAIAAALNAWPGITMKQPNEHVALFHADPAIILPITEKPAHE
jgi:hypothetical protein